ncbi:MAG TPA: SWIM zinc finger family protein [Longimicrobium sp.]|nr:SWIM zinc finger family protein [Longimicrobium sp.]
MSDWRDWETGPRRPARDGIKARSTRGDIGETWWSQRFIAALKEVADAGRLARGRSYARSGQVMDLAVSRGAVTARVQGSAARPYAVSIRLTPFTDAEWMRIEEAMAGQALFLAALLAGEMPRDVEQAFAAAGLALFPTRPAELKGDCSCPDGTNPCKHIAATYYILAEAFDTDPFLVLCWRGRARDDLLARLRELRDARPVEDESAAGDVVADADDSLPPPVDVAPADFWRAGGELAALAFRPRAPAVADAVPRQLGPLPPEAGGPEADAALAQDYAAFTRAAERRAFGFGERRAELEAGG